MQFMVRFSIKNLLASVTFFALAIGIFQFLCVYYLPSYVNKLLFSLAAFLFATAILVLFPRPVRYGGIVGVAILMLIPAVPIDNIFGLNVIFVIAPLAGMAVFGWLQEKPTIA
jgi:hypothetical protein